MANRRRLPLAGVKVLELAGLAPSPFAGMILADFGATVTRVGRPGQTGFRSANLDFLARGKRSVCVDLKQTTGLDVFKRLSKGSDVLIEPFRPGVMESLRLGPDELCTDNEKLIYVRMNGFGTKGNLEKRAGHDINYLAISGVLSMLGEKGRNPSPPINLLGDFAGGSFTAVMGTMMALYERSLSGKGQVVETSYTEGAAYVSSFLHRSQNWGWSEGRGENLLDGGAPFYQTYETKDGKYMAVGCLEPQFYQLFVDRLPLDEQQENMLRNQHDISEWPQMKVVISEIFKTKTRDEWTEIYEEVDACVTPVLEIGEAASHSHNVDNKTFMMNPKGWYEPCPAPKLSRTPGLNEVRADPEEGQHTCEVLLEEGFTRDEVQMLIDSRVVHQHLPSSSL